MNKIFSKKTYWILLAAIVPLWLMQLVQSGFFNRKPPGQAQVVALNSAIPKPEKIEAPEITERVEAHEPIVLKLSLSLDLLNQPQTIEARAEKNEAQLTEQARLGVRQSSQPAQQSSLDSTLKQGFFLKQANATIVVAAQAEPSVAKKSERQAAERQQDLLLNIDKLSRPKIDSPRADPFVAKLPPPPRPLPPAPPPPPPVPVAPALPFTFMGRMVESDRTILFLTKQNESYSVKLNDVLERDYRVDKIDNDQVVFTYLPLNIQQTLYIGRSG